MKKYLISGIGPGDSGGVGRLMKVLIPTYIDNGFEIIHNRDRQSIKKLISTGRYISAILELAARISDKAIFNVRCTGIKNCSIVIVHPQTIGFSLLFRLIGHNDVSVYVMDCSFFCVRSYNNHPTLNQECLQCVGNISPHALCNPFPNKMKKNKNIAYLKKLLDMSSQMKFLAQNVKQEELLNAHFGPGTNIDIIGMDTNEVADAANIPCKKDCVVKYNVVFHGVPHIAKGLLYVIDLAVQLPDFSFLIPSDHTSVLREAKIKSLPENIDCIEVSWDVGLKEFVRCADLVINPSLWSAPIEGALIKSAAYNDVVATVQSEYGFESEIKVIKNHMRLSSNVEIAAKQLSIYLSKLKN